MGTSASAPGSGPGAPLVPPWADLPNQPPLPAPLPGRFRDFRTSLGKFVATLDRENLDRAVGHYASTATGGAAAGVRRHGSMVRAGGALFGALGDSRGIEAGLRDVGLDLAALRGAPLRDALDAIAKAFAPKNGDGAKVEIAIVTALSEALGDEEDFDPAAFTDDVMNAALVVFLRECIFQQMMSETATAFNRTADKAQAADAERELHELVKVVVDVAMAGVLVGPVRALTRAQIEQVQTAAIREVWTRWEANIQ